MNPQLNLFHNEFPVQLTALGDNTYSLTVTWGQKPTGGYSIKIGRIEFDDSVLNVYITTKSPGPNQMVTQALTYPKDTIEFKSPVPPTKVNICLEKKGANFLYER